MKAFICLVLVAFSCANAGLIGGYGRPVIKAIKLVEVPSSVDIVGPPKPYSVGYDIVDDDGNRQGRQETGDSLGNKKGSYSIDLPDGRKRIVDYVADENGFRAVVKTNEPGTDASQDPADVQVEKLPGKVIIPKPSIIKVIPVLAPIGSLGGLKSALGLKAGGGPPHYGPGFW